MTFVRILISARFVNDPRDPVSGSLKSIGVCAGLRGIRYRKLLIVAPTIPMRLKTSIQKRLLSSRVSREFLTPNRLPDLTWTNGQTRTVHYTGVHEIRAG